MSTSPTPDKGGIPSDMSVGKSSIIIEKERRGTIISGWSVMANSMIGTGVLGLASAFASSGWALGFFLMTIAGFLALFSLHLLNVLSMKFPERDVSYYTVAEAYAPWSKWIVDITIVIKCFGVAVSYLQVAGDVLSSVVIHWSSTEMDPFTVRALLITGCGLLMAPVCMAKSVKNTFISNVMAVVTIGYCVILGMVYSDVTAGDDTAGVPPDSSILSILAKLPIFIFAFTCHQNLFLTANDLRNRTQKNLDIIIVAAESTAWVLYLPAVIFPYLTYGSEAKANFLLNISLSHIPVQIGYVALAVGVLCSYTLQVVPTIRSLIVLVTRDKEVENPTRRSILFYLVAVLCQLAPIATAIGVRSLGVTFSFVGIIGSNTISYIMPSFLFCTMYRKEATLRKGPVYVISALLLVVSLALVPLCVGSLIQQIAVGRI